MPAFTHSLALLPAGLWFPEGRDPAGAWPASETDGPPIEPGVDGAFRALIAGRDWPSTWRPGRHGPTSPLISSNSDSASKKERKGLGIARRREKPGDAVPFEVFVRGLQSFDWRRTIARIVPFQAFLAGGLWTFAFKGHLSRHGVGHVDFSRRTDLFHSGYFRVELEVKRDTDDRIGLRMPRAFGDGSRLVVRALECAGEEIVNDVDFPPRGRRPRRFEPEESLDFSAQERAAVEREYRDLLLHLPFWYDVFRPMKREFGSDPMLIDALTEAFVVTAQELVRDPQKERAPIIRKYLRWMVAHRRKEISVEGLPRHKRW